MAQTETTSHPGFVESPADRDADRPPIQKATEREREHFRKIGRWKHEGHIEALERHMARGANERLAYSVFMSRRYSHVPTWFERQDDPSPFYERAKQLGFYRA